MMRMQKTMCRCCIHGKNLLVLPLAADGPQPDRTNCDGRRTGA